MKKITLVILAFVFVFALLSLQAPKTAFAYKTADSQPIAPNVWTGGDQEVSVDLVANPAPDGLELKSEGIKVDNGTKTKKECMLRQILTKDLNTVRYDLGGCNSAVECLLPKQGAVGSNPITRSMKLGDDLPGRI